MYRKQKSINLKKKLHSFYLFHVLFSQSITNSARNVCCNKGSYLTSCSYFYVEVIPSTVLWSKPTLDQMPRKICHRVPRVFFVCRSHNRDIPSFSFITYYRTFTTMTSATSGAVTAYTSGTPELTHGILGCIRVSQSILFAYLFVFPISFCRCIVSPSNYGF